MIRSVLVANRGEIARRVFSTCRALGIACVAVHSDADAGAPFVREADAAVRLAGSSAADTYLRADLVVDAALRAGVDAVHPGYGFLSENADFAAAVLSAGLVWVGPPPQAIAAMGSKTAAKKAMEAAGVPVLAELDPATVVAADLPVLVKASAGGGGRGMRVVRSVADLPAALASASAEAAAAFSDGAVFVEPYVEHGRHVEVQVLADAHGTVWALGERECSVQRRHQKVLEESPSPAVDAVAGLREQLQDAAVAAARAIGYVGAGTVEFLLDTSGAAPRFFFLETNTRLQVEHPVTELRHGVDLVALQLAVADGERLDPQPPAAAGHAIEARLYAEDPADGWAPQTGVVRRFDVPGVDTRFGRPPRAGAPVLRLDSGVEAGSVVGPHYDAMLAKVIAWAPTRARAAARLGAALQGARLHGVRTNRRLLVAVLADGDFLAGRADTAYLERAAPALTDPARDDATTRLAALAAGLAAAQRAQQRAPVLSGLPSAWRNVQAVPQRAAFDTSTSRVEIAYRRVGGHLVPDGFAQVSVVSAAPDLVVLDVAGVRRSFEVAAYGAGRQQVVCVDSSLGSVDLVPVERLPEPTAAAAAGSLTAPLPGTVVRLGAVVGQRVVPGEPVLWLEAMKMEHPLLAPVGGVVTALPVAVGEQVEPGAVLAVVTADPAGPVESSRAVRTEEEIA